MYVAMVGPYPTKPSRPFGYVARSVREVLGRIADIITTPPYPIRYFSATE